jgi:hypothetical protein
MTFGRKFIIFTIFGLLHTNLVSALDFNVTNSNPNGAGSLSQAITDLNSTGTDNPAAASNNILIAPSIGTITLNSDLPVINRGVSISKSSGALTINGASSFRIFATSGASLALGNTASTTTLTNGLAAGGAGTNGGGGGLGAGGGIYVDLGQNLSITNVSIQSCEARGGNGNGVNSSINGGGGGGASFTVTKAASGQTGGGNSQAGQGTGGGTSGGSGGAAKGTTGEGYGGGTGGAGAGSTGTGAGVNASNGTPGAGGYCGGGGGLGPGTGGGGGPGGGGGGGGNGGGNGGQGTGGFGGGGGGGGGGGFGGGGGGGNGGAASIYLSGGGGGGGGFGGGGARGGNTLSGAFVAGGSGGGGGFGGGGGGAGTGALLGNGAPGTGGSYAGAGALSSGGGGAGIGGAIFVGDTATLNIAGSTATISTNNSTPGSGGGGGAVNGQGYADDIFLFKSATLNFNGAANLNFDGAIQSDTALNIPIDNGVTVNMTAPGFAVTLGSTDNNWRGGTVITTGGITAAVTNLPAAGNISIASQGTLTITGGASANTITNAGTLNFTGVASTSAQITNSGTMSISAAFTNNSTIINSGTTNLSGSFTGAGTFTHSGILNINSVSFTQPAIFNNTGMTNLNGTATIVGDFTGTTGSGLTVGDASSSNYSTSGNITGLTTLRTNPSGTANGTIFTINNTVTGGTSSTFNIGANSTVNLTNGASVTGFDNIVINGTYNIASGATYTLDSNHNLSGSGTISNEGQFFINGDVAFSGSFSNLASGTLTIGGTPTLTFSGTTFTNTGNLLANFSSSNSLPTINATNVVIPGNLNLSSGVIAIGYTNNFIASGNYTLLNAGTPPVPGVAILPQNTFYISDWSLTTVGNSLVVSVTRNGFDDHALTPQAQEIGAFLELLGASNPNASQLLLLNALEGIQNDSELTTALLSLMPPQYTMLVTLELLDQLAGALDIRLVSLNRGYSSGDDAGSDTVSVWLRPFRSEGTQQPDGTLNGYTDKNRGYLLGMDRTINHRLTLGAAASYSKTTITDALQSNTITNVNTYQFTFYSTFRSPKDIYLDALIAGGVSNYHGLRTVVFPGYTLGASSNYSSQQLTLKLRASKLFALADFWQLTPNAIAQYSFVRQLAFTESGAGSFDVYTNPDNINLFRLGVGTSLGIPFTTNNMLSIPSVYIGAYVDAKGGADTTNSQFVSGGPILTNSVQSGRLMLKYGASYELKFNENVQFTANYDYVWRNGFKGTEGLLNFRYTF